jgi:hypothetical protein
MSDDKLKLNLDMLEQRKKLQEQQEALEKKLQEAAAAVQGRMNDDVELQKASYMMLLGHQLARWGATRVSELEGIDSAMLYIVEQAQSEAASHPFDFAQMVTDLQNQQMPWLESHRRDALVRRKQKERRVAALTQRVRTKDVPLRFDGMHAPFGDEDDDKMQHEDQLLLFGSSGLTVPILRACASDYTKAGGRVALLASDRTAPECAELSLSNNAWKNKGDIYGSLLALLQVVVKQQLKPFGLLIVEDLDQLLAESVFREPRPRRLTRALAALCQFQSEYPIALLVGVDTDNDQPQGMKPDEVYPPLLTSLPYITVEKKKSDLVGGTENVFIGEEVVPVAQFLEKTKWDSQSKS